MIVICGNYGNTKTALNGQTIKTKTITEELIKRYGKNNIQIVDTSRSYKYIIGLIMQLIKASKKAAILIIMPGKNGLYVIAPVAYFIHKIYKTKVAYIVVGGWLSDFIKSHKLVKYTVSRFERVFVETKSMVCNLKKQGLKNVTYMPNFKSITPVAPTVVERKFNNLSVVKLCTFSRVCKEKGIEIAVEAISKLDKKQFSLDIYGQIDINQKNWFEHLSKRFPDNINYNGCIDYSESVNVLSQYTALLFPTFYDGEGFPGTLIDAMSAGLPSIVSNWKYNSEIIYNNINGIVLDSCDSDNLKNVVECITKNRTKWKTMSINCLKCANEFSPDRIMSEVYKLIEGA